MKQRVYMGILLLAMATGLASFFLHGFAPFSWLSYFTEMYPFFFGVSVLVGLFILVAKLPFRSLAGATAYWASVVGSVAGCLLVCLMGLFVNPVNWKGFKDYTFIDMIWVPLSNIIIILACITFGVVILRELKKIRACSRQRSEHNRVDLTAPHSTNEMPR